MKDSSDDGFRVVSRKKGRKRANFSDFASARNNRTASSTSCGRAPFQMTNEVDACSLLERVRLCMSDLQISNFFCEFKETWGSLHKEFSSQLHQYEMHSEDIRTAEHVGDDVTGGTLKTFDVNLSSSAPERNATSTTERTELPSEKEKTEPVESDDKARTYLQRSVDSTAESIMEEDGMLKQGSDDSNQSITNLGTSLHSTKGGREGGSDLVKSSETDSFQSRTDSRRSSSSAEFVRSEGVHNGDGAKGSSEMEREASGGIRLIVCYGLGNFSSCVTARFQLALLILLNSLVSPENCCLYDPSFTDVENEVLEELGYSLIQKNEEGKRLAEEATLFYMPHCGKPLYNNLLWTNWGQRLQNIVILGNSFNNFSERFTDNQLSQEVPYIQKIMPYHSETAVRNSFQFTDIFNDMAFHAFPPDVIKTAPSLLWLHNSEPCYDHLDNVEIITDSSR